MKKHILILTSIVLTLILSLTSCTENQPKPNLQEPAVETVTPAATQDTTAQKETGKTETSKKDDDDDDDDNKKK